MGYTFSEFAGLRVPDAAAGDDVPADLSYLVGQLDTAVVLKAASLGERDSKFYDAPSGTLCVVRAALTPFAISGVYVKTSDTGTANWSPIWEPPNELTFIALALQSAYTTRGTPAYNPGVWREPGGVFASLEGAVVRVDGSQMASGSTFAFVPSGYLPLRPNNDFGVATAYHSSGGYGNAKVTLNADGSLTYYGPNCNWVGLDNIRYFLAP